MIIARVPVTAPKAVMECSNLVQVMFKVVQSSIEQLIGGVGTGEEKKKRRKERKGARKCITRRKAQKPS